MGKKERAKRDQEIKERLGIGPQLAGGLAYTGVGPLIAPIQQMMAQIVTQGARSPIKAEAGAELKDIAEFSAEEIQKIVDLAKRRGIKIPILAAGPKSPMGSYYYGGTPIVDKAKEWLLKNIPSEHGEELRASMQDTTDQILRAKGIVSSQPHIALGTTSMPVAMHEIGHATPIAGREGLTSLWRALVGGASGLPGAIPRIMIASNVLSPPDDDASPVRQFTYKHAPELMGAMEAPRLVEEARASINALRGAREMGIGVGELLSQLGPAYGTYMAAASVPIVATILARKIVEALHKKNKELEPGGEKQAAAMAGAEVKAPGLLRQTASAAWRMSSAPKPKSIPPGGLSTKAKSSPLAKPPSKESFYKDMLESLYNPQRGARITAG